MTTSPQLTKIISDLNFLLHIIRRHRATYSSSGISILLGSLFLGLTPYFLGKLVDYISFTSSQINWDMILIYLVPYFCLQVGAVLFTVLAEYIIATKSEIISHELRTEIFETVFHDNTSHDKSRQQNRGMILTLFNRDVEALWDLFGYAITELLASIVIIVTMCVVVISINPIIGIGLIMLSIFFVVVSYLNGRRIRSYFAAAAPKFDRMLSFINAVMDGYDSVVSFQSQAWARSRVQSFSAEVTALANRAHRRSSFFSFYTTTLNILFALGLWVICLPGLSGEPDALLIISLGEFVALLFYLSMVTKPLETISSSAKIFSKSMVSVRRIHEFKDQYSISELAIDSTIEQSSQTGYASTSPVSTCCLPDKKILLDSLLCVDRVCVSTTQNNETSIMLLNGIYFHVNRNKLIGLAGESGSGKSMLLRVLACLHTVSSGEVILENKSYSDCNETDFRYKVIYINQVAAIFPVSLAENILFDDKLLTKDDSLNSIIYAGLEEASFATAMARFNHTQDLSTVGLSGGEAQRIALARGFIREPRLMLIDEPTSALDLSNSRKLASSLKGLTNASSGRSIIVASHDINVLQNCDEIILLSSGKLMEISDHQNLSRTSDLYQKIISSHHES